MVLRGADPAQLAGWLLTPVEYAVGQGNLRLFKKLIAAVVKGGVDLVGYRGKDGRTLFDAAARGGNAEIVSGLLRAGARPDLNIVSDSSGLSALYLAAELGHEEVACRLAVAGADVNFCAPADGVCVLSMAALRGLEELAERLLAGQASTEVPCTEGLFPLHIATNEGNNRIVQRLLDSGANMDALDRHGYSPLMLAACMRHPCVVGTLLDAGADLKFCSPDSDSCNAFEFAANRGDCEVVELFVKHGAELNNVEEDSLPLHAAARCGTWRVVEILCRAGADVNLLDLHKYTPFMYATLHSQIVAAQTLLRFGAVVGSVALSLVCRHQHEGFADTVLFLLKNGADGVVVFDDDTKTLEQLLEDGDGTPEEKKRARGFLGSVPSIWAIEQAWRRRSWLVMLRSKSLKAAADEAAANGGVTKAPRVQYAGGVETDPFGAVVASLVGLDLEELFRNVLSFV